MPKRAAVIGTGPAGIAAVRHLAMYPDEFTITAFDINRESGGLWNYSDNTEIDEYGLPSFSSIYKALRINLPAEVMGYPDEPFQSGIPSYAHHSEVKKYLDNYVKKHDLAKYMKFQRFVEEVSPNVGENDAITWTITTRDVNTDETSTDEFDCVFVAKGNATKADMPAFPGSDSFKGSIVHTKHHRDHEVYRGKTVIVVGAAYSASDIIFDIGPLVPKMYVAHRRKEPLPFALPDNVEEVPNIERIVHNGAILVNGEFIEADDIILATGYETSFPFLAPECDIVVTDKRVMPLYNQVVNIEKPSLFVIGLPRRVLNFRVSYVQGHFAVAVMRGTAKLPSKEEMYKHEEEDYQARVSSKGLHPKKAHDLFGVALQNYFDRLAEATDYRPISPLDMKIYERYCDLITYDYGTMKQRTFTLVGGEDFVETL